MKNRKTNITLSIEYHGWENAPYCMCKFTSTRRKRVYEERKFRLADELVEAVSYDLNSVRGRDISFSLPHENNGLFGDNPWQIGHAIQNLVDGFNDIRGNARRYLARGANLSKQGKKELQIAKSRKHYEGKYLNEEFEDPAPKGFERTWGRIKKYYEKRVWWGFSDKKREAISKLFYNFAITFKHYYQSEPISDLHNRLNIQQSDRSIRQSPIEDKLDEIYYLTRETGRWMDEELFRKLKAKIACRTLTEMEYSFLMNQTAEEVLTVLEYSTKKMEKLFNL